MAQEYKVLDFKKGTLKDDYDNWWCNMALEGVGEPVSIAVKDPMQFNPGMTIYGSLETKKSRAGKDYLKFKREKKEEAPAPTQNWSEDPVRQDSINRSVALNNANILFQSTAADVEDVLKAADQYYAWLNKGKLDKVIEEIGGEPINLDDIPY